MRWLNTVQMEWTARDVLQGWRGIGMLLVAALPTLFILLVAAIEGFPDPDEAREVVALMHTTFVFPPLVAVIAIIAGGAVLRQPLEDGTSVYILTRPHRRFTIGISRAVAVAVIVSLTAMLSALLISLPLGQWGLTFGALPGLAVGSFAIGALYGFIQSLHRWAFGASLIHAVMETSVSRVPLGVGRYTLTYHVWGAMGNAVDVAQQIGSVPPVTGNVVVALLFALIFVLLSGILFDRKGFGLGVAEA